MSQRYAKLLRQLQPPGVALPKSDDSLWGRLLATMADEFERMHGRMDDLVMEILLLGGEEMLDSWEEAVGLPDDCVDPPTDPDVRRARIRQKLASIGGQTPAYFEAIARAFGVEAEVYAEQPFRVFVNGMGDPVGGGIYRHVWTVHFQVPFDAAVRDLMRCVYLQLAPAHTAVLFRWTQPPVEISVAGASDYIDAYQTDGSSTQILGAYSFAPGTYIDNHIADIPIVISIGDLVAYIDDHAGDPSNSDILPDNAMTLTAYINDQVAGPSNFDILDSPHLVLANYIDNYGAADAT